VESVWVVTTGNNGFYSIMVGVVGWAMEVLKFVRVTHVENTNCPELLVVELNCKKKFYPPIAVKVLPLPMFL